VTKILSNKVFTDKVFTIFSHNSIFTRQFGFRKSHPTSLLESQSHQNLSDMGFHKAVSGPLLFLMYINDLQRSMKFSKTFLSIFSFMPTRYPVELNFLRSNPLIIFHHLGIVSKYLP